MDIGANLRASSRLSRRPRRPESSRYRVSGRKYAHARTGASSHHALGSGRGFGARIIAPCPTCEDFARLRCSQLSVEATAASAGSEIETGSSCSPSRYLESDPIVNALGECEVQFQPG